MSARIPRREFLKAGAGLVVAFSLPRVAKAQRAARGDAALGKPLATNEVDGFVAVNADGSVTIYSGKVDLGQGLRIAIPQMAAEELSLDVGRITLIEGDTALTPDQGPTGGSSGIMRGGVEIRRAAATAREALKALAAERMQRRAADLIAIDGQILASDGSAAIGYGELLQGRSFALKVDPKAPLRDPSTYRVVGKSIARPDIPGKVTGTHVYVHDMTVPGMLHARVIRPGSVGARLVAVDLPSIRGIPGVKVVRINDLVAIVGTDEWDVVAASRKLKVRWSDSAPLVGAAGVRDWLRAGPFESHETLVKVGDARGALDGPGKKLSAEYFWPIQSHASMGPSCAVADVRDGRATIWSASQATHRFRDTIARALGMPRDAVRVIYVDGSGCYGMNGHDDAAADAALLSRELARPVRVQWTREDELGWDPKGPPQMQALEARIDPDGRIAAWRTDMWLPKSTASLPNMPLLGLEAAGIAQAPGIATGLISQNGNPLVAVPNQEVVVHWIATAPLRPSNIRAPGKIGNLFAVESFTDELAHAAGRDPVEFRLAGIADPRGIEVVKRAAALANWRARPSPGPGGAGRGIAYMHYKNNETYVAMVIDVEVERSSGAIRVRRVACAHDCGLVINPDALRAQIEGNILQTLSRTLLEEVKFDRARVTSVDWATYPILAFPDVPDIRIDLVSRPNDPPLGAGEAASTPVPAALGNAVFDAAGIRLRAVPFTRERVRAAFG